MKNCVRKTQGKVEEIIEQIEKNKQLQRDSMQMKKGDTPKWCDGWELGELEHPEHGDRANSQHYKSNIQATDNVYGERETFVPKCQSGTKK